ncbi:MAG: Gfo/Idh/MocA family protein, partial [Verrucomicrobiia bacterium]
MKELRIGFIGFGARGNLVEQAHCPDLGTRVAALAEPNEGVHARFRQEVGQDAWITRDYMELLARPELDAVVIVTPDFLHEEHAVAALEAGKAVYLEKPMAITVEGCDRILRAAMKARARLYVGHNLRHQAVMRKMKDLIDRGAIGEVKAGWCRHFVAYG